VERFTITACPTAIAVGCKKCPAFSVRPLKGVACRPAEERRSAAGRGGRCAEAQGEV